MPYAFKKHEKDFDNWKNTGMNDIKPETRSAVNFYFQKPNGNPFSAIIKNQ